MIQVRLGRRIPSSIASYFHHTLQRSPRGLRNEIFRESPECRTEAHQAYQRHGLRGFHKRTFPGRAMAR